MMEESPTSPVTLEDLLSAIDLNQERVQRLSRQQRLGPLSIEAVAWLAASTYIPLPVAEILGLETIVNGLPVSELLVSGWILQVRHLPRLGIIGYDVLDSSRGLLTDELIERARTLDVCQTIRPAAQKVIERHLEVDMLARRLAQLVSQAESDRQLARVFDEETANAFESGDAVAVREWVAVGRPLAKLLSAYLITDLDQAVERAGRRVELLDRRRIDEHQLEGFIEREEQITPVRDLLTGPPGEWALHLLGAGGVGKTMLLRYLTTRLAPEYDAITARVDFDYLNPDYPLRNPGLLLWSLAQELRMQDSRAHELFDQAGRLLTDVRRGSSSAPAERPTDDPAFVSAVITYNNALRELGDRPIILILDTCEELAKIRGGGGEAVSVSETLRILRALHDGPETLAGGRGTNGVSNLRVIFAGRRPLPETEYIRVLELRGFTDEEASEYLEQLDVREDLIGPILDRSPEAPRAAVVPMDARSTEARRFNPYLLSYYGKWASADPDEAAKLIPISSGKRYIELRVVQRIRFAALTQALPIIAAAKHVDEPFIREVTGLPEADIATLIAELSDSEWTLVRYLPGSEGKSRRIISLKSGIQRDLAAYYEGPRAGRQRELARAAAYMRELTLHGDLSELDWTYFDAALRLTTGSAEDLCWWAEVEQRAVRERGYEWLQRLTDRLLAEEGAAAGEERQRDENPMRPAVLATDATAQLHVRRERVGGVWADVLGALRRPLDSVWAPLQRRAEIASLANRVFVEFGQIGNAVDEFWDEVLKEVEDLSILPEPDLGRAAVVVAAAENVIESIESLDAPSPEKAALATRIAGQASSGLQKLTVTVGSQTARESVITSFTDSLIGRAYLMAGDGSAALSHLASAVTAAAGINDVVDFRDWIVPQSLDARMKLEYIRGAYPNLVSAAHVLDFIEVPEEKASDADEERLLSAYLDVRAAVAPPAVAGVLGLLGWEPLVPSFAFTSESQLGAFPSTCAAHRATPPLFATTASVLAADGRINEAAAVLQYASAATTLERESVRAADRLLIDLIFRFRMHESGISATGRSIKSSRDPADLARTLSLPAWRSGFRVAESIFNTDPERQHAAWSAMTALTKKDRALVAGWSWTDVPSGISPAMRLQLLLDRKEWQLLTSSASKSGEAEPITADQFDLLEMSKRVQLEVALRYLALAEPNKRVEAIADECAESLGRRAAATIALDAGTHLLLRLPEQSFSLFKTAMAWFERSGDNVGVFIASTNAALARIISKTMGDFSEDVGGHAPDAFGELRLERSWPEMRDLIAAFESSPVNEPFINRLGADWRPMLTRFALGYLMRHEGSRLEVRSSTREWVAKLKSGEEGDTARVSADLQALLDATAPPEAEKKKSDVPALIGGLVLMGGLAYGVGEVIARVIHYQPEATWAYFALRIVAGLLTVGIVAALFNSKSRSGVGGLGCLAVTLAILWRVFHSATSSVLVSYSDNARIWIFAASVIILGLVLMFLIGHMLERVATLTDVFLKAAPAADQNRIGVFDIEVSMTKPKFAFLPSPHLVRHAGKTEKKTVTVDAGRFEPYRDVAGSMPDDLVKPLKTLYKDMSSEEPLRIDFEMTPESAAPCWEGLLSTAIEDKPPHKSRVRIRRTINHGVLSGRVDDLWSLPLEILTWSRSSLGQNLLSTSWAAVPPTIRLQKITTSSIVTRSSAPDPAKVVHVVAMFDERSNGIGIRSGDESASDDEVRVDRADSLRRRLPTIELCIIQGEPLATSRRSGADRQESMLARRFGAELAASGFPAVIVIPRLDTDRAIAAVQSLAQLLPHTRSLDFDQLFDIAQAIRAAITGRIDTPDDASLEMASDVTLYCADGWRVSIEG
jgi:hypothetical protein